mgnify:FL=1
MRVIGLTGGIASGKTTVSNLFKISGVPVIDADLVARQVVEKGTVGLSALVNRFGEAILNTDGTLNRTELGKRMFSEEAIRSEVNDILQPLIRQEITSRIQAYKDQGKALIVLDVPLLFEMHYDNLCDDIIVVAVSVETQIARMEKRNGYTREEALERIQSQMPLEEKVKRATIVWSNEGTLQELEQKVHQWLLENFLKK